MPNNKRNQQQRLRDRDAAHTDEKRTPSNDADKSGAALGKQSSNRRQGASHESGSKSSKSR